MYHVAYFLDQLINGVTLGAIYGLVAIGYTMVYGIIQHQLCTGQSSWTHVSYR